jgi:putative hydrolase of the HAD superfamily
MFGRLRAVVFDLDDTLYPERNYTRSGARAVAAFLDESLGETRALDELLRLEAEDPAGPLYSRWLALRGWELERWLPEIVGIHRSHRPSIALSGDARSLLTRLRAHYRLGLVTDGRLSQQRAKAAALGLEQFLDCTVFSDALGRDYWKPHPAPYWKALERLGVSPAEAVYVGDNPAKDFLGARRAGLRSIRLRREDGLHARAEPDSPEAAPDAEIGALQDLDRLLSGARFATL